MFSFLWNAKFPLSQGTGQRQERKYAKLLVSVLKSGFTYYNQIDAALYLMIRIHLLSKPTSKWSQHLAYSFFLSHVVVYPLMSSNTFRKPPTTDIKCC